MDTPIPQPPYTQYPISNSSPLFYIFFFFFFFFFFFYIYFNFIVFYSIICLISFMRGEHSLDDKAIITFVLYYIILSYFLYVSNGVNRYHGLEISVFIEILVAIE